jgi:hypothetical protein
MLEELTDLARQTSLGVLESHRRIADQLERFESNVALALPRQTGNRLRALASLEGLYGLDEPDGGAVFHVPSASTGTAETLAAQELLKYASQPDEVPPPPDRPRRLIMPKSRHLKALRRKEQADKK